ncbi:MAG: transcription termination/antitermination protein NusA [Cytophagales bacterium]|nr:MAG: transcription termination/antitermination protein NusA [Cytophagales bacterium]
MDSFNLVESFAQFARDKGIDRPTMMRILEDVFRTMIKKRFESDENFDIIINVDKGDLEIWRSRQIVSVDFFEDSFDYNENKHIVITDAQKVDASFQEGEDFSDEVKIEDFGRRMVTTARQTLVLKVKDLEKDLLLQKYKDIVGELVTAEVYQILGKEILLIDGNGSELILPKQEQIQKDRFRKGDNVKAVIHRVEMHNGQPKIILSRTSPVFLERLLENEVPEVYDGLISIKKVVREPGERAKVAVESFDDRIDPVGACVGVKGARIHSIIRELNSENIDVINFTENMELLISRALSPAKVTSVKINKEAGRVSVYLKPDQVSMAIGKGGQNIKLASKLIGLEIDVFRELDEIDDEDVDLNEFSDEIESWIIEELKKIGLDTAKSVLAVSKEDLTRRTELEEETIEEVLNIIKKEFEQ